MTIVDALIDRENYGDVRVVCGERWLTAHQDAEGQCFEVREQKHRQKYARLLVATENEDEACRFLISEKG